MTEAEINLDVRGELSKIWRIRQDYITRSFDGLMRRPNFIADCIDRDVPMAVNLTKSSFSTEIAKKVARILAGNVVQPGALALASIHTGVEEVEENPAFQKLAHKLEKEGYGVQVDNVTTAGVDYDWGIVNLSIHQI